MAINKKEFMKDIVKSMAINSPIGSAVRAARIVSPKVKRAVTGAGIKIGSTIEGAGETIKNYSQAAATNQKTKEMGPIMMKQYIKKQVKDLPLYNMKKISPR
jgi:hypothetical protein